MLTTCFFGSVYIDLSWTVLETADSVCFGLCFWKRNTTIETWGRLLDRLARVARYHILWGFPFLQLSSTFYKATLQEKRWAYISSLDGFLQCSRRRFSTRPCVCQQIEWYISYGLFDCAPVRYICNYTIACNSWSIQGTVFIIWYAYSVVKYFTVDHLVTFNLIMWSRTAMTQHDVAQTGCFI